MTALLPPRLRLILAKPVTYRGKTYDRINLREPTGRQMETAAREINVPAGGITALHMRHYQTALIAAVARVPRPVVLAMRERDIQRAFDYLSGFYQVRNEPEPKVPPPARRRRKPPKLRLVTTP